MNGSPFTLCVYCGSRDGARPAYAQAAQQVGEEIGRRGWQLVYGGGNVGLMGRVADAALGAGARVIGVIPRTLLEREVGHRHLHELHVVETMHERKSMMAQHAQAFLALPGGIGTLEELFEVWTWRHLGYHDQPVGLLDVEGYWRGLLDFMAGTEKEGFITPTQLGSIMSGTEVVPLLDRLAAGAAEGTGTEDFRRI